MSLRLLILSALALAAAVLWPAPPRRCPARPASRRRSRSRPPVVTTQRVTHTLTRPDRAGPRDRRHGHRLPGRRVHPRHHVRAPLHGRRLPRVRLLRGRPHADSRRRLHGEVGRLHAQGGRARHVRRAARRRQDRPRALDANDRRWRHGGGGGTDAGGVSADPLHDGGAVERAPARTAARPSAARRDPPRRARRGAIRSTLRYSFRRSTTWTEFTRLTVRHIPAAPRRASRARGRDAPTGGPSPSARGAWT